MRLARLLGISLLSAALAGCLSAETRAKIANPFGLLRPTADADAALVQYVLIERPAGAADVNRQAWGRVDEQVLPWEVRTVLEDAGLRVGIAGESAPGQLRRLIDDPRTPGGHRARTFALDRPAALPTTGLLDRAAFTIPAADGGRTPFSRDKAVLGFELTVRDGPDGRALVKLVPRARFADPTQLLPADAGDRGQATETFPAAGFEIALSPSEYLVVGTDDYWAGTFGHAALTGEGENGRVQRLLVLRAGRSRPDGASHPFSPAGPERAESPPLVSQVGTVRGARP